MQTSIRINFKPNSDLRNIQPPRNTLVKSRLPAERPRQALPPGHRAPRGTQPLLAAVQRAGSARGPHRARAPGHHLVGQVKQAEDCALCDSFSHEGHGISSTFHIKRSNDLKNKCEQFNDASLSGE